MYHQVLRHCAHILDIDVNTGTDYRYKADCAVLHYVDSAF